MNADDLRRQGSVQYHEDGTRVEILPRPYGASITTTKPDGSSETIKIGRAPMQERAALDDCDDSADEAESTVEAQAMNFASRMEAKFAPLRNMPQGQHRLAQIALKRLRNYSLNWLNDPNLDGEKAKAALSSLDGILAACPLELHKEVGGYINVYAFADDASRREEIKRRVQIMTVELERWLKEQGATLARPNHIETPPRSPKKVGIRESMQMKNCQNNSLEKSASGDGMSGKRKKIVAAGCLVICIASIINESGRYSWGTPSLSWLVLLCATWALIVWLWPESLSATRLKRWRRWRCKMKLRKQRNSIAQALTNLGLTEALFLESLNKGMNLMNGQLQQNCAAHGWRKMSLQELVLAHDALRIMMDMKNEHIRRAEKLIRKGILSDDGLLELARERHPGISDWRRLNHTEIDMMICLKTGTLPDWAKS